MAGSWEPRDVKDESRLLRLEHRRSGRTPEGSRFQVEAEVDPEVEQARQAEALRRAIRLGRAEGRREGREEARAEGYAEGFEQGKAEAWAQLEEEIAQRKAEHEAQVQAELDSLKAQIARFADDAHAAIRTFREESNEAHALFGLEVARRAVCQELKINKAAVLEIARSALTELHQGAEFRVLVSPAEVLELESHRQEIMETLTNIRGLDVVADRSIEAGCIVESHAGTIDARVEAYLERMAEHALEGDE